MLADALVTRGHDVTWWSSTFNHFTKSYRADRPTAIKVDTRLTVKLLHGRPGYKSNVSVARWRNQRSVAREFENALQSEQRPDVIVASLPTPEMCELAVQFAKERGVPVIVDIRDRWPDVYLTVVPSMVRGFAKALMNSEFNRLGRLLAGADAITAVSAADLQWAQARGASTAQMKMFPIGFKVDGQAPNSAESLRNRLQIPQSVDIAVFSGIFGKSYDLATVVRCASLFLQEGRPSPQFVLAGDGDQMPQLRKSCRGLPNVTLTGWLDHESLGTLIRTSAVGLCAYAANATQVLPNKPFEYLAAGIPIISSLEGELEEMIRSHEIGRQYTAGDSGSLHDAVVSILGEGGAHNRMSDNARDLFQRKYDSQRIYPEMAGFVESAAFSQPCR